MQIIDFSAGTHIATAAAELVEAAKAHGEARGKFNDIELTADAESTPGSIVSLFHQECARRANTYRNSPEGKAADREANERRASLQAQHDTLMARLPSLDWSNDGAVLDWLCAMQEPSDHIGVIVRRGTIVSTFEQRGFRANENIGPDYRDGDRVNMFRYLVGQALSGLKDGPAIHSIVHKFADQWRKRFGVESNNPPRPPAAR